MADYHAVLKRAIDALPENSGAARRAVYQKARSAIVNQLKSYDPPLSPSEITTEQLSLEEAIRKVEADAARLTLGLGRQPVAATGEAPRPVTTDAAVSDTKVAATTGQPADDAKIGERPAEPVAAGPEAKSEPKVEPAVEPKSDAKPDSKLDTKPDTKRDAISELKAAEAAKPSAGMSFFANLAGKSGAKVEPELEPAAAATADMAEKAAPVEKTEAAAGSTPTDKKTASAKEASGPARTDVPEVVADKGGKDQVKSTGKADLPFGATPQNGAQQHESPALAAAMKGLGTDAAGAEAKPSRLPVIAAIVAALIVFGGLAAGLYSQRDTIMAMLESAPEQEAGEVISPAPAETPVVRVPDAPKSGERLLGDDGAPVAPDARAVTTTRITPPGEVNGGATQAPRTDTAANTDDATPQGADTAEVPAGNEVVSETPLAALPAIPGAQPSDQSDGGLIVAQRSILYEEGDNADATGSAAQGQVSWSTAREVSPDSDVIDTVLKANVVIPDRNISVAVTIRPNHDNSLPASHLIEILFTLPPEFEGKGVANVPGLIMKTTEEARGDALIGASVRVDSGFFWVALSALEQEQQRNETLLRDRGWIDIPILYDNGKRAILTLEKGSPGDKAVQLALEAWTNS